MDHVVPDYRKTLPVLNQEWSSCTRCDLGVRRNNVNGHFVPGEGGTGGIMFIGEGPGKDEEAEGRPFVGRSGRILRFAIERLRIAHYYITNIVPCRSCAQAYDNEGQPRYNKSWKTGVLEPVIQDQAPTPAQIAACLPRLYQEIYLVDPTLIVALGGTAADVLARRSVKIQAENGTTIHVKVPGAGRRPALTDKRQLWARKVKGTLTLPSTQNEVEYLMVPLIHPAFVARKNRDERWGNPVQMFTEGMLSAVRAFDRYVFEVFGFEGLPERSLSEAEMHEVIDE